MSGERLAALTLFAFVTTITPGPNNLMVLASGANFGLRRTFAHMLGITLGFSLMLMILGFGLGRTLMQAPIAHAALKWGGVAYMLWLAARLLGLSAGAPGPEAAAPAAGRPMRFVEAAAFQWVNPKAWFIALGAVAAYVDSAQPGQGALIVAGVFALVCLPCVWCWAAFGAALKALLAAPKRLRLFNALMAGLLVLSLAPIVFD